MTVSVYNKSLVNIEPFKTNFGGNIYYDKRYYGGYKWSITKRSEILNLLDYLHKNKLRTTKKGKVTLVKQFYELCDIKAYKMSIQSQEMKSWITFLNK